MYQVTTQKKSYSSEQTITEIKSQTESLELYSKSIEEENYFTMLEEKQDGDWVKISYCFDDKNGKTTTDISELFHNVEDTELKHIYDEIYKGREEGLRPRILDLYIQKVRMVFPLNFTDALQYTEQLFWEEVGRRYFEMQIIPVKPISVMACDAFVLYEDYCITSGLSILDNLSTLTLVNKTLKKYGQIKHVSEISLKVYEELQKYLIEISIDKNSVLSRFLIDHYNSQLEIRKSIEESRNAEKWSIENCGLIKYMGNPGKDADGKCIGFARGHMDDERCKVCKNCEYCS